MLSAEEQAIRERWAPIRKDWVVMWTVLGPDDGSRYITPRDVQKDVYLKPDEATAFAAAPTDVATLLAALEAERAKVAKVQAHLDGLIDYEMKGLQENLALAREELASERAKVAHLEERKRDTIAILVKAQQRCCDKLEAERAKVARLRDALQYLAHSDHAYDHSNTKEILRHAEVICGRCWADHLLIHLEDPS